MGPARLRVAAVASLLLVTGCSGDASTPRVHSMTTPPRPSASPSVHLHATLLQYRPDEGTNRLEVELTNEGLHPVTVRSVRISWAGVRAAPRTAKDTSYAPGQTTDLTTTYGVAVCDGPTEAQRPRAVVTLDDHRIVVLPLDRHGANMLEQFHTRDCALQQIHAAVSISLGASFHRVRLNGAEYLRGTLVVRRRGGRKAGHAAPVRVTDLTGSVLLTFLTPPTVPLPQTLTSQKGSSTFRC